MKRLLSLLLSLVIVVSLLSPALAASDEATAAADALYELGLFGGTGTDANGNPIFDLDRAPTRHEAITMLVRLLGKTNEAESGTWSTPFTDVAEWAKPYVGYAYTNGLAGGTSATTFSGNENVTATQYITLVLRALGYESGTDFQWDKAWELSDRIGLTDGRYTVDTRNFTRGDVAIISHKALLLKQEQESEKCVDIGNTEADTTDKELTANNLQGIWKAADFGFVGGYEQELTISDNTFLLVTRVKDGVNPLLDSYMLGTFTLTSNILSVTVTNYSLNTSPHQETHSYQIDNFNGTGFELSENFATKFIRANHTEFTEDVALNIFGTTNPINANTTGDYSYLVTMDFRSVRWQYSQAIAQCGYALAYTDLNGDSCVLTIVQYKIISNYSVVTLHNLTQNKTITDPADYYNSMASRAYGGSKMRYWDLSSEVLTHQQESLTAMLSVLQSGTNTGGGVFVDAATLNQ